MERLTKYERKLVAQGARKGAARAVRAVAAKQFTRDASAFAGAVGGQMFFKDAKLFGQPLHYVAAAAAFANRYAGVVKVPAMLESGFLGLAIGEAAVQASKSEGARNILEDVLP